LVSIAVDGEATLPARLSGQIRLFREGSVRARDASTALARNLASPFERQTREAPFLFWLFVYYGAGHDDLLRHDNCS
jgi:hypothetical protein